MAWKKYQPDRTDFLINTEWGIPGGNLSKKEAQSTGKKLFQKRWVTREEKRRLQEEHAAYSSIRSTGILLIIGSGLLLINLFFLLKSSVSAKMIWAFFELVYAVALLAAGIGLFRFVCWGRNIALFIFLIFSDYALYSPARQRQRGAGTDDHRFDRFLLSAAPSGAQDICARSSRRRQSPCPAGKVRSIMDCLRNTCFGCSVHLFYL